MRSPKRILGLAILAAIAMLGALHLAEVLSIPKVHVSEAEAVECLFVQHAESVTLQDGLLTLEGIGEDVLYFSDRPHRIVGRSPVEWFVGAWEEGEDSFEANPPNAVLTVKKDAQGTETCLGIPVETGGQGKLTGGDGTGGGNPVAVAGSAFHWQCVGVAR